MADKRDYYEVLGLQKGATDDEIKKAYRKLAKENHPDLHPNDKEAEARFKEIGEAYAILSDADKRAKYDQFGFAGVDPNYGGGAGFNGDFGDLGDIFGDIFGGGFGGFGDIFGGGRSSSRHNPNAPQRGRDLRARITISFEEACFGCKKEIQISHTETCPDCNGNGCAPGKTAEICPDCHGTGTVVVQQRTAFGVMQSRGNCPKCGGKGKIIHDPCPKCHGSGQVKTTKTLSIDVPAGIDDGQAINLRGQGDGGINGGPAGDLQVVIQVKQDKRFVREGDNIYISQEIDIVQATLGAEIQIPTIDGEVSFTIPSGTQHGTTFRLRGKGVQSLRSGNRGDQFVTVNVLIPKNLNSEQKELMKKLGESFGDKSFGKKKKKIL